jgi:uncharacterized protein
MLLAWFRLVVLLTFALASSFCRAETPRQVTWDDLSVKLSAAENPFAALSMDQLELLVDVASARDRRARGMSLSQQDLAGEKSAADKLKNAGIDVDFLLGKRDEIAEKKRAKASAVNPALDGKLVRIPGYLLPLEFSGKQVTEFLLVPWVGACIHTPPPPPNQIVHVKSDKPFEMNGNFDAVWVTGRITASAVKKSVYVTDGSSEVDIGYSMRASQLERY